MTRLRLLCTQKLISCKYIWVSGDWSIRPPASVPILYRLNLLVEISHRHIAAGSSCVCFVCLFLELKLKIIAWSLNVRKIPASVREWPHRIQLEYLVWESTEMSWVETYPEHVSCNAIGFGPINDQVECFYRPCIMLCVWRTSRRRHNQPN